MDASGNFFVLALGFEIGLGVVAVFLGRIIGPVANDFVPRMSDLWSLGWGIGVGTLCALPMVAVVQGLQRLNIAQVDEINRLGREQILPMLRGLNLLELAALSIAAGVGEELLFRGWLQTLITGPISDWNLGSLVVGVLVASAFFGLAHAVTKLYVVVVFAMGILFGTMLVATGNLLVPITAHALFDFIQLWLAVAASDNQAPVAGAR
ncbi:CPBP family intramembrane glutamic endopeptidase [Rosistilla carotiformis]|uniref:CPBP family intramembrane glutamic endopeptidase n=1 Tax=Rosistilla carotiformis TaxID=2528017 RepID=UPI0018D2368B|nr:CPBP family intramembrane glutamic endopeptidase [Rosistilla carotiformis]